MLFREQGIRVFGNLDSHLWTYTGSIFSTEKPNLFLGFGGALLLALPRDHPPGGGPPFQTERVPSSGGRRPSRPFGTSVVLKLPATAVATLFYHYSAGLIEAALDALVHPNAPPPLVSVAVSAISAASREGLALPPGTAGALWNRVVQAPGAMWGSDAAEVVGRLAGRPLLEAILSAVFEPDAGRELTRAALMALAVPASAAKLLDADLLRLAERVEGRAALDLANVVLGVFESRRVDDSILELIAARCTASADPLVRGATLDLHALRGRRNVEAIEAFLLRDPSARVRSATALRIGELLDPEVALALVGYALGVEANREVVVELLRAQAELVALCP